MHTHVYMYRYACIRYTHIRVYVIKYFSHYYRHALYLWWLDSNNIIPSGDSKNRRLLIKEIYVYRYFDKFFSEREANERKRIFGCDRGGQGGSSCELYASDGNRSSSLEEQSGRKKLVKKRVDPTERRAREKEAVSRAFGVCVCACVFTCAWNASNFRLFFFFFFALAVAHRAGTGIYESSGRRRRGEGI